MRHLRLTKEVSSILDGFHCNTIYTQHTQFNTHSIKYVEAGRVLRQYMV